MMLSVRNRVFLLESHYLLIIREVSLCFCPLFLASRLVGKVRLYTFNPRFPFLKELKKLVAKAYEFVPEKEKDIYYRMRKRPRRAGKPNAFVNMLKRKK